MSDEVSRVLYARATYGDAEKDAVNEVLETPERLSGGPHTKEFESEVSELFAKDHGVMVNSGSSANLLAVEIFDFPPGSEVITPIVTFSTTIAPLVQNDLVPVFVDVGVGDYQIQVDQVREAISDDTVAIMVPSLIGNVPDLRALRDIADEHDLVLIEDSADTIGATIDGAPTGAFTDVSTTSFYGSHIITAFGGGGMLAVNDEHLLRRAQKLRGWGRSSATDESEDIDQRYETELDGIQYDSKFVFDEVGYNFLPLEASAAFGLEQLDRLPEFTDRRRTNFEDYLNFFGQHSEYFILPEEREEVATPWLAFPLALTDDAPFSRAEFVKHLESHDIQTRTAWTGNILRHPGFRDIECRCPLDEYENADYIMENAFVIGCHQSMGEPEREYVKSRVERFLSEIQ